MRYKYKFKNSKNGYQFILLPNNSNTQSIGISIYYPTKEVCVNALSKFRKSAKLFENNTYFHKIIKKERKQNEGTFFLELYDENRMMIFYSEKGVCNKTSINHKYNAILKNMDTNRII